MRELLRFFWNSTRGHRRAPWRSPCAGAWKPILAEDGQDQLCEDLGNSRSDPTLAGKEREGVVAAQLVTQDK
jgi:hypothetical protein